MINKQDLLIFTKNIRLLLKIVNIFKDKYIIKNYTYYIIYSPFIYNKIEGCKETKNIFKNILLKELNISEKEYMDNMKLSMESFIPDILFFIKIHSFFPEFENNYKLWLNLLYFSNINLQYQYETGKIIDLFLKNVDLLNINFLNQRNIVIPLNLLFEEGKKILENNNLTLKDVKNNNLLLMLISDYKDILLDIRKKDYIFNKNIINDNMLYIVNKIGCSINDLYNLDYKSLMKKNYLNYNKNTDFIKVDIDSNKSEVIDKTKSFVKSFEGKFFRAYKNNRYILLYVYDDKYNINNRHFSKYILKIIIDFKNNNKVIGILFGKEIDLAWIIKEKILYNLDITNNNISGFINYKFNNNKGINKLNIVGDFKSEIYEDIINKNYISDIEINKYNLNIYVLEDDREILNKKINFCFGYEPLKNVKQFTLIENKKTRVNGINYRFIKKDCNISIKNNKLTYLYININGEEIFLIDKDLKSIVKSNIIVDSIDLYNNLLILDIIINSKYTILIKGKIISKFYNEFQ